MKTAVVILNWNTQELLRQFLPGIIESCREDSYVVVADSGSTDGSVEMLHEEFPQVRVIALGDNYGFTGGYNRALSQIDDAEYFVLLNSDIEVSADWLDPLEDWMDSHPNCGICGPKLLSYFERDHFEYAGAAGGYIDRFGYPFCRGRVLSMTEKDFGQYDDPAEVLWVSGACLMIRRSLWNEMGGLDDRFFAHMEEIDLCWRVKRAGWSVNVIPDSKVWHLGGATLPKSSPQKLYLNYRNNLLLLNNNLPKSKHWIISARMVLDCFSSMVYLLSGKMESVKAVVRAHKDYKKMKSAQSEQGKIVYGYLPICILPLAALFKKKIFTYIRRYENSH